MKMPDLIFISKDGDVFKFDERVHDNPTHQATHIVEALRRENEELKAKLDKAKWQPIETAPKDERVLLWTGQEKYCGHWSKNPFTNHEAWIIAEWGNDGDQALLENPTHWMPLPDAPEQR